MMSFWDDASVITKAVIAVGTLGLLYFMSAFALGLPPFAGDCSHRVDGVEIDGCPPGSSCVDGSCVAAQRGPR